MCNNMTKQYHDYLVDIMSDGFRKDGVTKEHIEEIFRLFQISPSTRVEILEKTMGADKTFYTPENMSDEDKYKCNLQMFAAGEWRKLITASCH